MCTAMNFDKCANFPFQLSRIIIGNLKLTQQLINLQVHV